MNIKSIVSHRLFAIFIVLTFAFQPSLNAAENQGGFIESSTTTQVRPVFSQNQIQGFLPGRGEFTFPAPYNTKAVRLTNGSDCGGQDCINYAGYAYWRNINNHAGRESMLIFVSLDRSRGGPGPSLIEYNKSTGAVTQLGPLFGDGNALSWSTGEGWYFSASKPTKLYVNDGFRIQRLDVISGALETVMDIRVASGSNYFITQLHSSDDDNVHSATVRDAASFETLGCMSYTESSNNYQYFPRQGGFDECQVDRSGDWLVIKENVDGVNGEDNRIINLRSGQERLLLDSQGAGGHSDLGHGYMIAADNWAGEANTWRLWNFLDSNLTGHTAYHNLDWGSFAPAHVSHSNARADLAPEQQFACGSSVNRNNSTHGNEIICFGLDSSLDTLVVAPTMTDLNAAGGGNDYAKLPKGNLDTTGEYFFWTSNMGGDRLDAFLVKVPDYLASGEPAPVQSDDGSTQGDDSESSTTDEESSTTEEESSTTEDETTTDNTDSELSTSDVRWENLVNASVNGTRLSKSSGCDGCADAGATSAQEVTQGDGTLLFTATDTGDFIYVGLTSQSSQTDSNAIDFALRLQSGIAEVRENGSYRSDTSFAGGDIFRITIVANTVRYTKNGNVFYTSNAVPQFPLQAQAVLISANSSVDNATLSSASGDESAISAPEATTETTTKTTTGTKTEAATETSDTVSQIVSISTTAELPANAVVWGNSMNVTDAHNRLSKTSGCDGCADADAVSLQSITNGDGTLLFTTTDSSDLIYVGLTQEQSPSGSNAFDFSLRLQSGIAEVRENGSYRSDTSFNGGDTFQITIVGKKVQYGKNGTVFYTGNTEPRYPLYAATVLHPANSAIEGTALVSESAPKISDLQVKATDGTTATVNWASDIGAESLVQFGTSSNYDRVTSHETQLTTQHSATLNGLSADTRYHFRVFNRGADGHVVSTTDHVFTMPALK